MSDRDKTIQQATQKFRIVFKAIQAHSKRVEKICGLSSAQLGMLNEVMATPGLKVSQLAAALTIHPSTCSNMLDKLENKELITRDRRKSDQRSVHLYITEKGKTLLQDAPKPLQGQLTNALEQLDNRQLDNLCAALDDLIQAIDITDKQAGMVPIS